MNVSMARVGMFAGGAAFLTAGVTMAARVNSAQERGKDANVLIPATLIAMLGVAGGTMAWTAHLPSTQAALIGIGLGGAAGALVGGSLMKL
jgi:zinc transporter ZupT